MILASTVGLGQEAPSAQANGLIGHWRNTIINFESPQDTHLVLGAGGKWEQWVVTAGSSGAKTTGHWEIDGKTLMLKSDEGEEVLSAPFTMYEGQLVLPNIPNQRRFWEKID